MFAGHSFHEGATVIPADWLPITAMLVERRHLAASVVLRYRFGE